MIDNDNDNTIATVNNNKSIKDNIGNTDKNENNNNNSKRMNK